MNGEIEMENKQYFRPTVNEVYTSIIGLQYRCLSADGFDAELMNTESKWILKVTGCQIDDDGKIHWDSSERKLYTAEDFVLKSVMMETNNSWSYAFDTDGQFDINLSDILTFLIHRVGKYTKYYASDLFISWQNVDDIVHTLPDEDTKDYKIMFGIRESGVDFDNMITNNINGNSLDKGLAVYTGGIYMMEIHIEKYESYWERPKMFVKFGEATLKET